MTPHLLVVVAFACNALACGDGDPISPDRPWTWHALVLVLVGGVFNGAGIEIHRRRLGERGPPLAFMSRVGLARVWGSVGIGLALSAVLPFPPFSTMRPTNGGELLSMLVVCAIAAAALFGYGRWRARSR